MEISWHSNAVCLVKQKYEMLIIQDFYNEIILGFDKKVICVEKENKYPED